MREFTEEEREEHRLRMQKLKEQILQRAAEIKKEEAKGLEEIIDKKYEKSPNVIFFTCICILKYFD